MKRLLYSLLIVLCGISAFARQTDDEQLLADTTPGIHAIDEVVVTGTFTSRTLKNTPILTKVISGSDIQLSGATTALEALENFVPGVIFTPNPMGDNIQIAGLENKYILILVDGERLVYERTENVNFSRLNASNIKQIEIVNGASSVLYGSNAIGAVINIITKDVDKPLQGLIRARYSNYNTCVFDASFGFKVNDFTAKTVFTAKNSDGYSLPSQFTMDPYSDYTISQVFKYRLNDKLDAELKGTYYNNKTWFLHKYQIRMDEDYTAGGKLRYILSNKNALTFSGNTDKYEGHLTYKFRNNSSVYANGSQYSTLRLVDAWDVTKLIQFITGTEVNLEKTFSYNQFGNPAERNASNWNLFTQGEFKTESGLEALVGVRYTNHSQFGAYLSPKISLIYRLDNFRFRGNISNGYKAPTVKELYMNFPHRIGDDIPFYVIGNEDLIPEESWYKAISAEYISNDLNASITIHDNSIKNRINTILIIKEQATGEYHYENIEDAQITGVDFSLQWTFLKNFQLKAGYSFADAIDKGNGQQLSGNSKHTATLNLVYKQRHWPFLSATDTPYSLSLSGRAMSPHLFYSTLDSSEITDKSTGSYFISSLVYSQQFPVYNKLSGDFQFGINNLFNYVNRDYVSNNPGRTCFISLGLKF
jgi:outer membrane receptor for ferrienterochelin and colicins